METLKLSQSLLEPLVAVVATLGELAATMRTAGDTPVATSGVSWHRNLWTFIGDLRDTLGDTKDTSLGHRGDTSLGHRGDTSLGHHGDTSLGHALMATPGPSSDQLLAMATSWRGSVAALGASWAGLVSKAIELCHLCRDTATTEATAAATARPGHLRDEVTRWATAGDSLVAAARRLPLALDEAKADEAVAAHEARVTAALDELVAATKAVGDAVVATSQAGAATKRGQRAVAALGPLGRLVAECGKATALPRELLRRLGDIEAALRGTRGTREDAVAAVAEAERLWVATARLARCHLLGTLEDIEFLLDTRPGGPGGLGGLGGPGGLGGLGGPSDHSVAKRCQEATEAIPKLLKGQ